MKKLLRSVRAAFRIQKITRPLTDESKRNIVRGTVRSVTTGSVRLQRGQYATKDDLDRRYERVKKHDFEDA